jgi:hypothetical protein
MATNPCVFNVKYPQKSELAARYVMPNAFKQSKNLALSAGFFNQVMTRLASDSVSLQLKDFRRTTV